MPEGFLFFVGLLNFTGDLLIVLSCCLALYRSLAQGLLAARRVMSDGLLGGLGFILAGSILWTLQVRTWNALLTFATLLSIRTFLGVVFRWEHARLLS